MKLVVRLIEVFVIIGAIISFWPVILAIGIGALIIWGIVLVIKEDRRKVRINNNVMLIDQLSGLEFEEVVVELLKANGYTDVSKTQNSGDYGVDVLATKEGKKYAIQCKRYSSKVNTKVVQETYAGTAYYKADVAVILTNNDFTAPAIKMARNLKVELWNRNDLDRLVAKYKALQKKNERAEKKAIKHEVAKKKMA